MIKYKIVYMLRNSMSIPMKISSLIKNSLLLSAFAFSSIGCRDLISINKDLIPGLTNTTGTTSTSSMMNGINIMDLGISGTVLPGVYNTNYTKPSLASLQYLRGRGNKVIRIPFLWERLQPTLGGALDTAYLGYIMDVLRDAKTADVKIILDMHNYGRYTISGVAYPFGSSNGPTIANYQDAWTKLTNVIKADANANAAVYAFDIMNEPYDLVDTRNTIPDSGATTIVGFASTSEGFNGENATVAHSASYNGSLAITGSVASGSYGTFGTNKVPMTLTSTGGSTIRVRGFIPSNLQGDYIRVRLTSYNTSWAPTQYSVHVVNKGEWFEVYDTLSNAQWSDIMGLQVEVIMNNPNGSGPYVFYLDDISQGTPITGKSPQLVWEEYSQGAVDAIRTAGGTYKIMVEGYDYSSVKNWATNHPVKWITDPMNETIYQGHTYMDSNFSGSYSNSFATETSNAIGGGYASVSDRSIQNVKVFTDWLAAQNAKGYIGEIGWPNSAVSGDSASWDQVGDDVLTFLDSKNVGYTLWATGTWLGPTTNALNAYDIQSTPVPLSPAVILESHLNQ